MIDTLLVRAEEREYRVRVETNAATVVSDSWSTLNTLSADLSHVDAYMDDGAFVVVVREFPYQEFSTITIDPLTEVTFPRIRGVWILGLPVSY